MDLTFDQATERDAPELAALRTAAALRLTAEHGRGHWSSAVTERSVVRGLSHAKVLVVREGERLVGTLRLATKKPWAIDVDYFTPVTRALYLHDMAVAPGLQRRGIGQQLMDEAVNVARAWPAGAIRLDAYDAPAGAGDFYARCGYREVGRVVYRKVSLRYFEKLL